MDLHIINLIESDPKIYLNRFEKLIYLKLGEGGYMCNSKYFQQAKKKR